jgi:hypothetical protein
VIRFNSSQRYFNQSGFLWLSKGHIYNIKISFHICRFLTRRTAHRIFPAKVAYYLDSTLKSGLQFHFFCSWMFLCQAANEGISIVGPIIYFFSFITVRLVSQIRVQRKKVYDRSNNADPFVGSLTKKHPATKKMKL